jgi:hypothetical protein
VIDHPILFSTPMIRANLREIEHPGTGKTQTRRIIKPQPTGIITSHCWFNAPVYGFITKGRPTENWQTVKLLAQSGDRLWVREAWRTECNHYDDLKPSKMGGDETVLYDADKEWSLNKSVGRARPSMFMPRWASRITLIVTDVRVQRLQDISEEDAIAEGVETERCCGVPSDACGTHLRGCCGQPEAVEPIDAYRELWDRINGPGSWAVDPFVVAYTYQPYLSNIDQMTAATEDRARA